MKLTSSVQVRGWVPLVVGSATVVLLLVFFLLLSTSFLMQPGVAVELPASRFLLPAMQDPLVVTVTGGPAARVFFEEQEVALSGLGERLEERRTASRQLVIKADREAPIALVAEVSDIALQRGFNVALAGSRPATP